MIVVTASTDKGAHQGAGGAGRLTVLTEPLLSDELVVAVNDALKAFDTLPRPRSPYVEGAADEKILRHD